MPIPARSIPTRVGAESLSTGTSTELDTHGREAALRAPTPIREDRTQPGKCCVSSSSIRSHSSQLSLGQSVRTAHFYEFTAWLVNRRVHDFLFGRFQRREFLD